MLFKDQCVYRVSVDQYEETDTTITSIGYRVKVGGSYVTDMRVFRNVGTIDAVINIESLIEFNNDLFFAYLGSFSSVGNSAYAVPSATKTCNVELYTLVYTKETGDTVESLLGSVTMSNVIDGKFGNYFPSTMISQGTDSTYVMLTNKYLWDSNIFITENTYDVVSFYAISTTTVRLYDSSGTTITSVSCAAGGLYIVSLNARKWGSALNKYRVAILGIDSMIYNIEIGTYLDNLPLRRGTCYEETGDTRFNLFVKTPWGGLDNIGNLNLTSINGSSSRNQVRIQDTSYVRGGSANNFETTTQSASAFSTSSLPVRSEGRSSYSYDAYIANVNELWFSAIAGSKVGYLVMSSEVSGIMEVEIDSVSGSIETIEGDDKIWKISVSCTQKIPFVA